MRRRNAKKIFVGNLIAISVIAMTIVLAGHFNAQAQQVGQSGKKSEGKNDLTVGTYNPDKAFQEHPAYSKLEQATGKAQESMQKAQQEGDQQKMQQIQQEFQQTRNQSIQEFEQDVSQVMPKVAKESGVEAVAEAIVYTAKNVKTKDITPELINSFEKEENKGKQKRERELPAFPKQKR